MGAWPHSKTLWTLVEGVKLHSRTRVDDISTCFSRPKAFTDWELEFVRGGQEQTSANKEINQRARGEYERMLHRWMGGWMDCVGPVDASVI